MSNGTKEALEELREQHSTVKSEILKLLEVSGTVTKEKFKDELFKIFLLMK